MARFHGNVGFIIQEDNQDTGIVRERVVERPFYGRIIENTRRWQMPDAGAKDVTLNIRIAITANDYAFSHATAIAYVCYMGGKWKVESMTPKPPEIILNLGGVYNGPIKNGVSE